MAEDMTVADIAAAEVTAPNAGEPQVLVIEDTQETNAAVREFEARLADMQAALEREAAARKTAEAEALRQQAIYRGFQKEVGPKLQERSQLLKERQAQAQLEARLSRIEKLSELAVARTLDPEEAEKFQAQLQLEQLKSERDALAAQLAEPRVTEQPEPESVFDKEERKRELFSRYFPNSTIDVNDSRINWAEDVNRFPTYEAWETAFTSSVQRIEQEERAVAEREAAIREAQEARRLAAEEAELIRRNAEAEAERIRTEAAEAARIEREEKLRALGADVTPTAVPEGISVQQTLDQMYPIDERWLASGNPADIARYNAALSNRANAMRQALAEARSRRR